MALPSPLPFLLGVNYPWVRYGQDFGCGPWGDCGVSTPETYATVGADFARIRECGATVVRWFLFGDGRSGILASAGIPRRPDRLLFPDVAAALALAEKNQVRLCFSLIDFPWLQERRASSVSSPPLPSVPLPNEKVLHFAAGREAFLENILVPLFREFRAHSALFAWEIANEPEWAISEFAPSPMATMPLADFRVFAGEISRAVGEFAYVPVTLGSARLLWLPAWTRLGLTLLQAHYYPQLERDQPLDLAGLLAALPHFDEPLWLGELPFRDPASPNYSFNTALASCRAAQLCGAALWRWREPDPGGSDVALGAADPQELQAWLALNSARGV
ncbi:MAG: hypothetical protein PVS2B2_03940 [Candidatus Acidiferrum sp.]